MGTSELDGNRCVYRWDRRSSNSMISYSRELVTSKEENAVSFLLSRISHVGVSSLSLKRVEPRVSLLSLAMLFMCSSRQLSPACRRCAVTAQECGG